MASKLARSRSSLLTNTRRGTPRSAAIRHATSVCTCDAVDRADHEHGEVGDPQGGGHVAHEVGVAGGVDEVDLVAVPLERGDGERQRQAALVLLGREVAHGGAVLDPAERVVAPARWNSASARLVLPAPPCPTRATLRI